MSLTTLTAMEKLEHIAACPDGCGVCKLMANDVRARIAELQVMGEETMFKLVAAEKRIAELEAQMPECKKCEGAGSVVIMSDGSILPFYRAPENVGEEKRCDECDGYGHVTDARKHEWSKHRNGEASSMTPTHDDATDWSLMGPLYRDRIIELEALIAELEAAITEFSKATSMKDGPSLAMQRHEPTWKAWKKLCERLAP